MKKAGGKEFILHYLHVRHYALTPDTRFILSLWQARRPRAQLKRGVPEESLAPGDDLNYTPATQLFSRFSRETWLWCDLHQMEVPIAAQVATHRAHDPLKEHVAKTIVFRAERAVTRGGFLRKLLPLESVSFALGLATAHRWSRRLNTLDLWHIGAAWELGADYFATFDERQAEIARTVKFATNL